MSDTHFILTGVIALIVLGVGMWIIYYVTQSFILMIATSFVITEIAFVTLAMNREGFFLWAMVIFFIPFYHFAVLATFAYHNSSSRPKQETNINKMPKELRDVFQEQDN